MSVPRQKPSHTERVRVGAHEVVVRRYGDSGEALLLLSGGPGLPVSHLATPFLHLADNGYRIIAHDQLGTGESDRPDDRSLWSLARSVEEVETVRRAMGLERFHLIGHSWGGWLSIEYALAYPDALSSLVLSNTCADMPHLQSELDRLKQGLGVETYSRMQMHEAHGDFDHWEYKAAISLLNAQHVCRLDPLPDAVAVARETFNAAPYNTVQGPNEFLYIGTLKDWSRLDDLHRIDVPTLVLCGRYDEMTPVCARMMASRLPKARLHVFPNSSHVPFYEETESYFAVLRDFLNRAKG